MSKIETSEILLPKKNITSGSILEKCSFILNMREWASCHETMDPTDKSKYPVKWLWNVTMHTIIPYEWQTEIRDDGEPHLRPIDWSQSAITGGYLVEYQGYQKGQFKRRDRVNMLGRSMEEDMDIYNEIDGMIEEFPPKLLNQLRTELGSAMNRASVHPLSIKYSEDRFASLRRLQEYIALFVNFVSRNHQEHSDMWNKYTSRKYETSDQVMEFLEIADQLVFIMEILEKKDSDKIQRDAIRKVIAIATSDQSHLRESQKNHLNEMARMVLRNIDQGSVKMTLSSVLMKLANALMLPTGQGSPSDTRLGGAQALMAMEQQVRKRKSPTKAIDEWHIRHDKKMNDTLSILGQMVKAQEGGKERSTQENSGYYPPGNSRGGGRGGGKRGGRGGPRAPFNHRQGQDNSKELVQGKQQASRAAAQEQKRQKKSIKESASDREENSDNEYPEYAYQARPEELRLGPRVKIAAEEYDEDEWESPSLYGRANGDLDTYRRKTASNYTEPKPKVRLDKTRSTGYNSVESDEEGMQHLIDSDGDIYTGDPVNEGQARERTTVLSIGSAFRRIIGNYPK